MKNLSIYCIVLISIIILSCRSKPKRALIYSELGEKMMPSRWENIRGIYNKNQINAIFKTFEGIWHGKDLKMNDDISDFFRKHQ